MNRGPVATALHGTRVEDPGTTRARLQPTLADHGITRVANVTGLDRLGVPVYMAIRPNSRSLSVSQGKGADHDAAWVSAVMEAIELAHAEVPAIPLHLGSYRELCRRGRVVDVERLPARDGSCVDPDRDITWASGIDLVDGEPVFVPYALVHVNAVAPFPPGDESFAVTSNGLASGTVREEALVHALCEAIERDGVTRWQHARPETRAATWIDVSTITDDVAARLVAQCRDRGFDVLAADATPSVGVPVVVCLLLDHTEMSDTLRAASMGFGCHLRRDVAFVRALTEAAQSRLTLIAGSRDDLDRRDYEVRRRYRDGIAVYRAQLDATQPVDFQCLPDLGCASLRDQVAVLLDALGRAGVREVPCVDLTCSETGPAVVRVLAPGLRGPDHAH